MPALGAAFADAFLPVQQGRDRRQLRHAIGLGELHVRQGLHGATEHRIADDGGAIDDVFQRSEVVGAQRRMIDEHLDHGRHQQHVGDAMLLHGAGDAVGRKALDNDVGAAAEQARIHRRAIGEVEHRRGVQINSGAGKQPFAERMERIHHQIAVAEHDALGTAGGAAGIEDAAEIAADPHRIGHRRAALDQLFEIVHARRRLAVVGIDQLQAGDGLYERQADRRKRLVHEQDAGAAIAHGVLVLQRAPADVERNDHGAGPARRKVKLEIAVGVHRQHRDAIAGLRTEGADSRREPRHALADLAPVLPSLATDDGQAIRIDLQRTTQSMSDVHRFPPRTFFTLDGGFSAFFFDDFAAIPSVRRIANSAAMSSAGRGPPG